MIKAENVTKIFTGRGVVVRAVDGVSTTVDKGEVVVVIGPSGSGKSTFIRCINGLEMFEEGHVYIDGVDIVDKKTNINKIRAEVGMVFQQLNGTGKPDPGSDARAQAQEEGSPGQGSHAARKSRDW